MWLYGVFTYIWQPHDKVMKEGLLCRLHNFLHAHGARVVPILNVLGDAAVKQHRLLGHDADLGPQEGHVNFGGRSTINQLQGKKGSGEKVKVLELQSGSESDVRTT